MPQSNSSSTTIYSHVQGIVNGNDPLITAICNCDLVDGTIIADLAAAMDHLHFKTHTDTGPYTTDGRTINCTIESFNGSWVASNGVLVSSAIARNMLPPHDQTQPFEVHMELVITITDPNGSGGAVVKQVKTPATVVVQPRLGE